MLGRYLEFDVTLDVLIICLFLLYFVRGVVGPDYFSCDFDTLALMLLIGVCFCVELRSFSDFCYFFLLASMNYII